MGNQPRVSSKTMQSDYVLQALKSFQPALAQSGLRQREGKRERFPLTGEQLARGLAGARSSQLGVLLPPSSARPPWLVDLLLLERGLLEALVRPVSSLWPREVASCEETAAVVELASPAAAPRAATRLRDTTV